MPRLSAQHRPGKEDMPHLPPEDRQTTQHREVQQKREGLLLARAQVDNQTEPRDEGGTAVSKCRLMWPAIRPQTKLLSRVPRTPGRCKPGPRSNARQTAGDLLYVFIFNPLGLAGRRLRTFSRPYFERDPPHRHGRTYPSPSFASKQPFQGNQPRMYFAFFGICMASG